MIDERTKKMIEAYIPNPPDPDLPHGAYYWLQSGKVLTVYPLDVLPHDDHTEYGIYQYKGGKLVRLDAGYGCGYRGVRLRDLYDNKEDCRNQTHGWCDDWERLREIQQKEMKN